MRTADVVFQYDKDPRCIAVGFLPAGEIKAVVVNCHGGGWIAQTNTETWRHDPSYELEGTSALDAYMNAGVAYFWIEYPYGWHADCEARYFPSNRYPTIPRSVGRCIQYLKTHRADGLATGSTSIVLPDEDFAYALKGDSAGAFMALYAGLQPDGWLDYDPDGRKQGVGRFDFTRSHRVGCIFAYGTPIDLRRYEASVAALPYFGPSSKFHGPAVSDSAEPLLSTFGKFNQVPERTKYASTPTSLAEARLRDNLNVSILVSNGLSLYESRFMQAGVAFEFDESFLVGSRPSAGQSITAAGGATGTVRACYDQDSSDLVAIVIDAGSAGTDVLANWTGTLTWGGGSLDLAAAGVTTIYGNDNYREVLDEDEFLAIYDVDNEPLATTSPHTVNYVPAFKREREAHFTANPTATSYDRWYLGDQYQYSLLAGYDGAAFGHTDIDNVTVELAMFEERGVTF